MTYKALIKVKKKHKAWQRYMESPNGEQYRNYARQRNQAKNEIRKSVKMYEKNIAKEAKENPPKFWNYVKGKLKTNSSIPQLQKQDGHTTTSDTDKANTMNNYFGLVYTREAGDPPTLDNHQYDEPSPL